jgi:hypothetical protein
MRDHLEIVVELGVLGLFLWTVFVGAALLSGAA